MRSFHESSYHSNGVWIISATTSNLNGISWRKADLKWQTFQFGCLYIFLIQSFCQVTLLLWCAVINPQEREYSLFVLCVARLIVGCVFTVTSQLALNFHLICVEGNPQKCEAIWWTFNFLHGKWNTQLHAHHSDDEYVVSTGKWSWWSQSQEVIQVMEITFELPRQQVGKYIKTALELNWAQMVNKHQHKDYDPIPLPMTWWVHRQESEFLAS